MVEEKEIILESPHPVMLTSAVEEKEIILESPQPVVLTSAPSQSSHNIKLCSQALLKLHYYHYPLSKQHGWILFSMEKRTAKYPRDVENWY
jgi:hypothetical protein